MNDLPGRGRGVKVSRSFHVTEVVCDYSGELLSNKEGKEQYESTADNQMDRCTDYV